MILAPLGAYYAVMFCIGHLPIIGVIAQQGVKFFSPAILSLCAVGLLSGRWARQRGWLALLSSLLTTVAVIALSYVSVNGSSSDALPGTLFALILGAAVMLGFAFAGARCRRRFRGARFATWLYLGMLGVCLVGLLIVYSFVLASGVGIRIGLILWATAAGGAATSLFLWILLIPFLVLLFKNSLYRARAVALFGVTQPLPALPAADNSNNRLVIPTRSD